MIDVLHEKIAEIENEIFKGDNQLIIKKILVVKSNVLNFKTIMQAHRSMIHKLLKTEMLFFGNTKEVTLYYNELFDHVKDIWGILETYEESIESLENTSNAIIDQTTARTITTLTVLTILTFPFTILGGIFGMNTLHTPLMGKQFDFWYVFGIMVCLSTGLYLYFKKKNYL